MEPRIQINLLSVNLVDIVILLRHVNIVELPMNKKRNKWIALILLILFYPLGVTFFASKSKLNKKIKVGLIAIAWISFLLIIISGTGDNSSEKIQENNPSTEVNQFANISDEKTNNTEVQTDAPKANKVEIAFSGEGFVLGQEEQLVASVYPEEIDLERLTWSSNNPEAVSVDETGKIIAVGAGEATITANIDEVSSSVVVSVDGTHRLMKLKISNERLDDSNIGSDWIYGQYLNGERVPNEIILSEGETLQFYLRYEEQDNSPDIGEAATTYTISAEDFANGFTVQLQVNITEDRGKNAGQTANFVVTYEFTP